MGKKYRIDQERLNKLWNLRGYDSLKDVFRDKFYNENAYMRYDYTNKKINSGEVSYGIIKFLSDKLNCPIEYLTGELSEELVNMFGMPGPSFSDQQNFFNMTEEEKELYRKNFLIDLGIYGQWMKMDNRERNLCHTAIVEFSRWMLDYLKPSEETYLEMYDFFSKTGVHMIENDELRKELLLTMQKAYRDFLENHAQ